jgi:phage baseplate assembly protein W
MNSFLPKQQTELFGRGRSTPDSSSRAVPSVGVADPATPNQQKDWLGRGWAYPVALDPLTGGVAIAEYEIDIRQSIEIILGTAPGERVMRPDFGCGIYELVFEVIDASLLTRVQAAVTRAMVTYEARIEVLSVNVNPLYAADGLLLIEFQYRVRRTNQKDNMVYPFYFREGGPVQAEGSRG